VPENLVATAVSSGQINLAWADKYSDEMGFKIERKTGVGGYMQIAVVGANVQAYSDNYLSASTGYYYRVRAYSAAGDSAYSNEGSAVTLLPPPPVPVLRLPGYGSVVSTLLPRLEWNVSAGAVSYDVQVATNYGFSSLVVNESGIGTLYYDLVTPLNWNTAYFWRVRAVNGGGSPSAWSLPYYFRTATGP